MHDRDDLPRLIRCGRHLARTKRYIRNYAARGRAARARRGRRAGGARGDGWVKLVGDWISREDGDLAPSFPADAFADAIAAAHEHGARVTAHCFGEAVLPGLIEAGIDCIEHGTGLYTDLIDAMVERGTALVPTVMQLDKFPEYAEAGGRALPGVRRPHDRPARASAGRRSWRPTTPASPLYAGSDGGGVSRHGNIAGEIVAMAELGMPAEYALGAASWRAREWLGWNADPRRGRPGRLRGPTTATR